MNKGRAEGGTVGNKIYMIIRNNIINLNLAPGTAMSEKELSEKLEVSRTPVREAFIKLAKEGLVNIVPQKGTFISKIDCTMADEERFLRESIERAVLELFVKEHSEESIIRLERCIEKQKKAVANGKYDEFMEYDDQFHKIIFEDVKKSMCYDVTVGMSGNYRRIRFLSMMVEDVIERNIQQHEEIVKAIMSNDVELSKKILKSHLRKLMTEKDDIVEKYPEYFENTTKLPFLTELFSENNILKQNLKNNK